MKRLLYCVFLGGGSRKLPALRGVDGRPVSCIGDGGLCAATSPVEEVSLVSTVERILAYAEVVEAIFGRRAIVPMRFGSILESEAEVIRHLQERAPEYRAWLRELAGCAEMGIRVLEVPRAVRVEPAEGPRSRARPPPAPRSGHAYLQARAEVFRQDEEPARDLSGLVERYRRTFHGLYTRMKVELPGPVRLVVGIAGTPRLETGAGGVTSGPVPPVDPARQGALAMSFLVPKRRVEAFRQAFERIGPGEATSRLSGPWPPYSFVTP